MSELTRGILVEFLEPAWLRTEPILAHARLFFADLDPAVQGSMTIATLKERLEGVGDSIRKYASCVLLDLATVDPSLEQAPLAVALRLSEELGVGEAFLDLAGEELDLPKRSLLRLKKDAASIIAGAAAGRPEA
jgi:hypothetical protein